MYGPRRGYVGGPGAPDAPEADPLSFDELYSPLSEPYLPLAGVLSGIPILIDLRVKPLLDPSVPHPDAFLVQHF